MERMLWYMVAVLGMVTLILQDNHLAFPRSGTNDDAGVAEGVRLF